MQALFPFLNPGLLIAVLGIAFCSGFVKGVVGFAMPLVMISGLTLFLAPELALAGLILPTLVANIAQAMRQGPAAAWGSIKKFRYFLFAGGVALVLAAQTVRVLPIEALQLAIGVPTVGYAILQLAGVQFQLPHQRPIMESFVGVVAGIMGGLSAVWGPPTVMYLTALNTPKADQMRIQGVIYCAGSIALVGAHLGSGVLRTETVPFSILLILPAFAGMWVGGRVVDAIDQVMFKRATLLVLLLAGSNLIRRALF
ncbi:MAG: sulfite exporter TauE/SafE family protein [Sulfitobacter sp.]